MRSLLFVPGDSEKKLDKGRSSGADALILDLEDSVSADRKAAARATTLAFLQEAKREDLRLIVRVNALDTGLTDDDLDAVIPGRPDAIMLPKAAGGASVTHLHAKLSAREAMTGLPMAIASSIARPKLSEFDGETKRSIAACAGRVSSIQSSQVKRSANPSTLVSRFNSRRKPLPGEMSTPTTRKCASGTFFIIS